MSTIEEMIAEVHRLRVIHKQAYAVQKQTEQANDEARATLRDASAALTAVVAGIMEYAFGEELAMDKAYSAYLFMSETRSLRAANSSSVKQPAA